MDGLKMLVGYCLFRLFDKMPFGMKSKALVGLNKALSDYFVRKADEEMSKMWNEGMLTDEKIEKFRFLHERTSYMYDSNIGI